MRQAQVNPKIDWTFAKALRAFLRADPDVIMVGEIRDHETDDMGVEASLTGHLVLTTLHTNSAPETVTRLLDMGMDPFNFSDALLVVLARRLPGVRAVQRAACRESSHRVPLRLPRREAVATEWRARLGIDGVLMAYSSNQTGYQGRAGLHELLSVSREIRRLIQTGGNAENLLH